jgi:uncharacterized membrane protein
MNKEKLGALIDAIYAIAMTVLVLEIPTPHQGEQLGGSITMLLIPIGDYAVSFILLFAFWCHQRRINDLVEIHSRLTLWLNGMALMGVCLVPFSASLLFSLGRGTSSLLEFTYGSAADILFVGICLSVDFFIFLSLWIIQRTHLHAPQDHQQVERLLRSRIITTVAVIFSMFCAYALPGPDSITLFALPLLLIFEEEMVKFWEWIQQLQRNKNLGMVQTYLQQVISKSK